MRHAVEDYKYGETSQDTMLFQFTCSARKRRDVVESSACVEGRLLDDLVFRVVAFF